MAITQVTYERVFNLGNYENHRISATATVENDDHVAAFAMARSAVEAQHTIFVEERNIAIKRKQEQLEAEMKRRAEEMLIRYADDTEDGDDDDEDLPL
jgi:hypothetical protein